MDALHYDPQIKGIEQVVTEALNLIEIGLEVDGTEAIYTHIIEPGLESELSDSQRIRIWGAAKRLFDRGAQSTGRKLVCVCGPGTSGLNVEDVVYLVSFGEYYRANSLIRKSRWSPELKMISYAYLLNSRGLLDRFVNIWGDTWTGVADDSPPVDTLHSRDVLLAGVWLWHRLQGRLAPTTERLKEPVRKTLEAFDGALNGSVRIPVAQTCLGETDRFFQSALGSLLESSMYDWLYAVDLVVNSNEVVQNTTLMKDTASIAADDQDALKSFTSDEWHYVKMMVDQILSVSDARYLGKVAVALRERDYSLAERYLFEIDGLGSLSDSLRIYLLSFVECSKESPQLISDKLRSRLIQSISPEQSADFASYLALHQAYILLLLREGRVDRARSELLILDAKLNRNEFNLHHSVRFFREAIAVFEAARKGKIPPPSAIDGELQKDGLYAQLRHDFRNIGSAEDSDLISRLFPPAGIIRELYRYRVDGDYAGYVRYAGERCDELIHAGFSDSEFIFSVRLEQARVLERLGRLEHAERVSNYIHNRSIRLGLSDRLRISSNVLHVRLLLALGRLEDAAQQLNSSTARTPLSPSETYVLSMSHEAAGRLTEAIAALESFLSSDPDEATYEFLELTESAVLARFSSLNVCVSKSLVITRSELS